MRLASAIITQPLGSAPNFVPLCLCTLTTNFSRKDLLGLPPSFFQTGQKHQARVVALGEDKDFYQLSVAGQRISAYSETLLTIGETVNLEVIKSGEQPQLKIVKVTVQLSAAEKILKSCRIEITPANLQLIEEYLAAELPVQFNQITSYFKNKKKT